MVAIEESAIRGCCVIQRIQGGALGGWGAGGWFDLYLQNIGPIKMPQTKLSLSSCSYFYFAMPVSAPSRASQNCGLMLVMLRSE